MNIELKVIQARLLEIDAHILESERLAAEVNTNEVDTAKKKFKQALENERQRLKADESAIIKMGYHQNSTYPNIPASNYQNYAAWRYNVAVDRESFSIFAMALDIDPVRDYLKNLLSLTKAESNRDTLKESFCKKIGESVFNAVFSDLELGSTCDFANTKFVNEGLEKTQHEAFLKIINFLESPDEELEPGETEIKKAA